MPTQSDLFDSAPVIAGLAQWSDTVDAACEQDLIAHIDASALQPFKFGQWTGKRLTASFGSDYDYARGRTTPAPALPRWALDLRERLASLVGLAPDTLQQVLVIRYDPGAGIGWHRDRPQYGDVLGLSLGAPATLRLRRRTGEGNFARHAIDLEPRGLYRLSGEARTVWEHSIVPMEQTRWSITMRTFA